MLKSILVLMTGSAIVQSVPILISPILSRIYSPEYFGTYFVFLSVLTVVGSIATLRYEVTILLPEDPSEAAALFIISILGAILVAAATLMCVAILDWLGWYAESQFSLYYYLPLAVVLWGVFSACQYWLNRKKQYKNIAKANVIAALVTPVIQITAGIGMAGAFGLVAGRLVGLLATTIYMANNARSLLKDLGAIASSKLRSMSAKYKKYPLLSAPGVFLNSLANNLDILVITSVFGLVFGGIVGLAIRLAELPRGLLATSVWQVFVGTKVHESDENIHAAIKVAQKKLIAFVTLPFLSVIFIPESVFIFLFGQEWGAVGLYIGIYIVGVHANLIVSSFSLFVIKNRPDAEMYFNLALLLAKIGAVVLGVFYFEDLVLTVVLLTVSRFILFIFLGGWNYGLLGQRARDFYFLYFYQSMKVVPILLLFGLLEWVYLATDLQMIFSLVAVNAVYVLMKTRSVSNEYAAQSKKDSL